jgi:hypothetical protein
VAPEASSSVRVWLSLSKSKGDSAHMSVRVGPPVGWLAFVHSTCSFR